MPYTLQNEFIDLLFDEPGEEYKGSRFDWTGQVRQVMLKNGITFCGTERKKPDAFSGRGLSGEFGIDCPIGYDECQMGEKFIKIGVGLLTRKSSSAYHFSEQYTITPASFSITRPCEETISFRSFIDDNKGYGYDLEKSYSLYNRMLCINYTLKNTGNKPWSTNEYCHNFISIGQFPVDNKYSLRFSDVLDLNGFTERVDPQQLIGISENRLSWKNVPQGEFFLAGIAGISGPVTSWEVVHSIVGAGMKESCDFIPCQCNLWGCGHVLSPEIFISIHLQPGAQILWQRNYSFFMDNG